MMWGFIETSWENNVFELFLSSIFTIKKKWFVGLSVFARIILLLELVCFNFILELLTIQFFLQSNTNFYLNENENKVF